MDVTLREVRDDDLDVLFAYGQEPEAVWMAAFTAADPADRVAFDAHWARLRADASVVTLAVVGDDGAVLGHAGVWGRPGEREITYWIGREHWGRGIATAALRALLLIEPDRPLHARAAADNAASIRVLEKCGFVVTGTDWGFANARGAEVDEVVLALRR
jgi:RimJ/RimL family protein N-acetyltransferase